MKLMMKKTLIILVVLAGLLAACAPVSSQPTPPEIHFGEDMCSDCGMIINDAKFASAYSADDGNGRFQSYIFDDIGDMLHHMQANLTLKGVNWWVHDYNSEEWIDATTAFYVVSDQIKSPMNHGIAAFATQAAADTLAQQTGGQVLDWDKVRVEHALAGHGH